MKIKKINRQNFTDINKASQPFEIIGKIKPTFADGKWTYTEELYENPYVKEYWKHRIIIYWRAVL